MKLKTLLLLVALLLIVAIVASAGYKMWRDVPGYYRRLEALRDPDRRSRLANQASAKLNPIHNVASQAQATESALSHARRAGATLPVAAAVGSVTVSLGEEEINAFLLHWSEPYKGKYEAHIADPRIFLQDGQVIFAATVKELGTVVSVGFEPRLDASGHLSLRLAQTSGGRVPLPRAVFDRQVEKVSARLRARLPVWQHEARMGENGAVNDDAVKAALSRLLLNALDGRPSDAVVFVPVLGQHGKVPLAISQLQIEDNALTLTVQPLTRQQRAQTIDQIRAPFPAAR